MVSDFQDLNYGKKLEKIEQTPLHNRREQGDVITIYKLANGIEKVETGSGAAGKCMCRNKRKHN